MATTVYNYAIYGTKIEDSSEEIVNLLKIYTTDVPAAVSQFGGDNVRLAIFTTNAVAQAVATDLAASPAFGKYYTPTGYTVVEMSGSL
jgi:hypothetical protein